jgi:hypothetical protein
MRQVTAVVLSLNGLIAATDVAPLVVAVGDVDEPCWPLLEQQDCLL